VPAAPGRLPVNPAPPVPFQPYADRRKRHQVVRFDRRALAPAAPTELEPVRELRAGRSKEHVIVHFEPKPRDEWEVLNEVEA
jgi:hypothetical protein